MLEIKIVKFEDLPQKLKDEVIANFQEDEFLVPEDWYTWIFDDFVDNLKNTYGIDIDDDTFTFDLYRNELEFRGTIDDSHKFIKDIMSSRLKKYEADEWVYDLPSSFENYELETEDYSIDIDVIDEYIKSNIFLNPLENDSKIEIEFDIEQAIDKWLNGLDYEPDYKNLLLSVKTGIAASKMFFQDVYNMNVNEFYDLTSEIHAEIESQIENEIELYVEEINKFLEEKYDELQTALQSSWDYFYSDEYAEENLNGREFEVEVDEDGNQELISFDPIN